MLLSSLVPLLMIFLSMSNDKFQRKGSTRLKGDCHIRDEEVRLTKNIHRSLLADRRGNLLINSPNMKLYLMVGGTGDVQGHDHRLIELQHR